MIGFVKQERSSPDCAYKQTEEGVAVMIGFVKPEQSSPDIAYK